MKKSEIILVVLVVSILILLGTLLTPIMSAETDFKGNAKDFTIEGNFSTIKARDVSVVCNIDRAEFDGVQTIIITNESGSTESITEFDRIEVYFNEDAPIPINNAFVWLSYLENCIIKPDNDNFADIFISGDSNCPFNEIRFSSDSSNSISSIGFNDIQVEHLLIDGKEIRNFTSVILNSEGSITFDLHNFKQSNFYLWKPSQIKIEGEPKSIILHRSEGLLRIADRPFVINYPDTLNVVFSFNQQPYVKIEESDVEFSGVTNYSSLNNQKLLTSNLIYWFNHQPEKASALFAFLLVILTAYYAFQNKQLVKQAEISLQQTEISLQQTELIIKQSRETQKIERMEKKLEFFYYPLQSRLNELFFELDEQLEKDPNYSIRFEKPNEFLKEVIPYQYMASEELEKFFKDFIKGTLKTKSINLNNKAALAILMNQVSLDINEIKRELTIYFKVIN